MKIRITKLDALFSKVVRARDKCCQRCGTTKNLQCAHIFSRRNKSVRWDLDNAIALCFFHHLYWAHSEPIQFTEWVKKRLGRRFGPLRRRAMTPHQPTQRDLDRIEQFLKAKLK